MSKPLIFTVLEFLYNGEHVEQSTHYVAAFTSAEAEQAFATERRRHNVASSVDVDRAIHYILTDAAIQQAADHGCTHQVQMYLGNGSQTMSRDMFRRWVGQATVPHHYDGITTPGTWRRI